MYDNEKGLKRLCSVYEKLNDNDKGKLIKLGEGLLNSQKIMENGITKPTEKKEGNNEKD
jgi:hypothetical protein